jgi:hypothetical protein
MRSRRTSACFRLGNGIRFSDVLSDANLVPRTVDIASNLFVCLKLDFPVDDIAVFQRIQIKVICSHGFGLGSASYRLNICSRSRGSCPMVSAFGFLVSRRSSASFRLGIYNRFSVGKLQPFFGGQKAFLLWRRKAVGVSQPKNGWRFPTEN